MKTVSVYFANHFDLTWRRCWSRDYQYEGARYASYQRIEELCLQRNIELAEQGDGAYTVEQGLTLRAFLAKHPEALSRLKALYARGLFEIYGAGEAIIDINMCAFETMCRNLASGVDYCRRVLGMPPLLACHDDGFGSSAQFPQVIRQCGLPGIQGLSYSLPDNTYWRGLDGSTILVWKGAPGRAGFYDHCYHEPCRTCGGHAPEACAACRGTGLDLPQNVYPPFEPAPPGEFLGNRAQYVVRSEEMLPPEGFSRLLRAWEGRQPGIQYVWSTPRQLASLWQPLVTDTPPAAQVSSRVENNPVQTGCYVSRIRIKQEARRCESLLYGWETALALTCPAAMDAASWEAAFLELPLFFFHDAVTGTHQDEACRELLDRMAALREKVVLQAERTLGAAGCPGLPAPARPAAGQAVAAFSPGLKAIPLRIPLADTPWLEAVPLVAVGQDGRRWPVVRDWHRWSPPVPAVPDRFAEAVGASARTRPHEGRTRIETDALPPWQWQELRLERAPEPVPVSDRELHNAFLTIELGDQGITRIRDLETGATIHGDTVAAIGGLVLEEDQGDPWGTRRVPAFHRPLSPFTRFLGARRFEGYTEAYYSGRYEPNLRFGREEDPALFALEWMTTVRLLDTARRVDFGYELFWKSENRRIRAVFPVQADGDTAWYSIPGGFLERPRYEQTETCLWSPNGDWPALHHVAARPATGQRAGWAVVNYGTPSARVADGRIQMSLLRSPGFGHCLERYAQSYPMPTSGLRDGGWHHFTLSLVPHGGVDDMSRLAALASSLNQAIPAIACSAGSSLPPAPFRITGEGIELLAAKRPFDGGPDRVIRLLNNQPRPATAVFSTASGQRLVITPTRLTEDDGTREISGQTLPLEFKPFEVRTFRVAMRDQ